MPPLKKPAVEQVVLKVEPLEELFRGFLHEKIN
jgi:hypothetical protein